MTIAEQVFVARTAAELSQAELARRAGVSAVCVTHIESGRGTGLDTIRKLAAALNAEFTIRGDA